MARSHLVLGAICTALGLADLALLNLWIAPRAFPGSKQLALEPRPAPVAQTEEPRSAPLEPTEEPAPVAKTEEPAPPPIAKTEEPAPAVAKTEEPPAPAVAKTALAARRLVIRFGSSTSLISPADAEAIRALALALHRERYQQIVVEGHTDQRGETDLNQRLSWLRAQAVASILIAERIPAGRIAARGIGSSRPLDAADTADGWANNRRVEIQVLRTETER